MRGDGINAEFRADVRSWSWLVGAALLIAACVRIWGLGDRGITHPEIYVPGIALPADISEPPPRLDLKSAIWWHYHDEPHPMGWYLGMFAWTTVAGTSEWALRLPSVLFALAAIPCIWWLGRSVYSAAVGGLAAALLALHGFHVFWSQTARMYSAGVFLALLSTCLVLRLADSDGPRPRLELAYVASVLMGIQTVELFWPVLLMHAAWVALAAPDVSDRLTASSIHWRPPGPRLLQLVSVALIFAAPALVHSVYRARGGAAAYPRPEFLADYFAFGFLFADDRHQIPMLSVPAPWHWVLLMVGLCLLAIALRATVRGKAPESPDEPLPAWLLLAAAVSSSVVILGLGAIAFRRRAVLMALVVLPWMAFALPALAAVLRSALTSLRLDQVRKAIASRALLLWLLAVVAPLALFVVSYRISVLAPRAFLVFLPALLVVSAAGALRIASSRKASLAIGGALCLLFALSLPYAAQKPGSPRDYKTLAAQMIPAMEDGDVVFVTRRDWTDTPFFYYVPDARYVVEEWSSALETAERVWLVTWPYEDMPVIHDERRDALAQWQRVEHFEALRASAELFVPAAP